MGDKAYSSEANRAYLRRHGIQAVIPVKEDQKANRLERGSAGGGPPNFDAERYKEHNTVERCFNKLRLSSGVQGGLRLACGRVEGHRQVLMDHHPGAVRPLEHPGSA